MPWKASSVMEERLCFVARLLDGEAMTDMCREFGISRKTGYKIFDRYREHGLEALTDRSRRPVRYANQPSESRRSTKAFGSSASCTTISDTSTWSRKPCNPSTTRSARGCHPCLRYVPLPMSPGWTRYQLVAGEGLEPPTPGL